MIENIIFDIGNVLVRWDPQKIINTLFPKALDPEKLMKSIFKSPVWYALNEGQITDEEALIYYHKVLKIETSQLSQLMPLTKASLIPLEGSFDFIQRLAATGIPLYSLTDNTHSLLHYLKKTYDVFKVFKGIVVSADLGILKPDKQIFNHLLTTYQLDANKTLFFDDIMKNVEGAQSVGIQAFQFTTAKACETLLKEKFSLIF